MSQKVLPKKEFNQNIYYEQFKEYLEDLPSWDGKGRLDDVIQNCFSISFHDKRKSRWISRYMYYHAVKLAYKPSAHATFNEIPVLAGPQACGKTSFVLGLLPPKLRIGGYSYLANELNAISAIYCEITDARDDWDRDMIKDLCLIRSRNYRLKFQSKIYQVPARTVYIGTTNSISIKTREGVYQYVVVLKVNLNKVSDPCKFLTEHNEQLWAEAKERYITNQERLMDWRDYKGIR